MNAKLKDLLSKIFHFTGILFLNSILSRKKLTIITFHRIVPSDVKDKSPNKSMMTTIEEFDKFIKMIGKYTNPLPLETAISFINYKTPFLRRSTVITFDDGYADNYTNAYPILKKYNVPATIFLTTKYIGQNDKWFWWDEIENFFAQNNGTRLNHHKSISPKLIDTINKIIETKKDKISKIRTFIHDLYNISQKERDTLVELIKKEHSETLMLSWEQMNSMTSHFQIGSHTVSHAFLNTLSPNDLSNEFNRSKCTIEREINKFIICKSICYPAGFVTDKVVNQAKKSAYESGVTTIPVNNSLKTNVFLLNRKDSGYFFLNDKLKISYFFFVLSSFYDLFELIRNFKTTIKKFINK